MSENNNLIPEPANSVTIGGNKYLIGVDLGSPAGDAPAFTFVNDTDTGFYSSGAGTISFSIGNSSVDDVYDLFFKGKTIKDNSEEYMEVIMRLPGIEQQQLDAIETLEFFRRQFFPEPDEK